MKKWLTKLRVSAEIDSHRSISESLERKVANSPERRDEFEKMKQLGEALKKSPQPKAPETLHASILRAVRTSSQQNQPSRANFGLRWAVVSLCALVAIIGTGLLIQTSRMSTQESHVTGLATIVFETGNTTVNAMETSMVSPLMKELENIHLDVDKTRDAVLASLPIGI